jgi:two-component system phosphate regulon response regulator OmpR
VEQRVLLIEDDSRLAATVAEYLGEAGFRVSICPSAQSGLEKLACEPFVLMVTAREPAHRVVGLEISADDYLPKPVAPRKPLAKLRAILRRSAPGRPARIPRFGRLEIDRDARVVRVEGGKRSLTSHQFALLAALADNAGRVLSRDALMDLVRGAGYAFAKQQS